MLVDYWGVLSIDRANRGYRLSYLSSIYMDHVMALGTDRPIFRTYSIWTSCSVGSRRAMAASGDGTLAV
jgi:hypothetical protein